MNCITDQRKITFRLYQIKYNLIGTGQSKKEKLEKYDDKKKIKEKNQQFQKKFGRDIN